MVGLLLPAVSGTGVEVASLVGAKLTPDDAHEPGVFGYPSHTMVNFGSSLDVDGDTLVVGTTYGSGSRLDWVYVFERDPGGPWVQTAKLVSSDEETQPRAGFGKSVAVDEEAGVLVVGVPGYDLEGEQNAGAAYVFERDGQGGWTEVAKFIGPNPPGVEHRPRFGWSVAVEADTAVVGAPLVPGTSDSEVRGAVYVLERGPQGWDVRTQLGPYEEGAHDRLGYSVGLADGTIVAGATWGRPASGEPMGAATVFEEGPTGWEMSEVIWPPLPDDAGSPNGVFGFSLDLESDTLIVGDPGWGATPGWGTSPGVLGEAKFTVGLGAAYVFDQGAEGWTLAGELHSPTPHAYIVFGDSVAVDEAGERVLVGADHFAEVTAVSSPTGTAYLFEREGPSPFLLTAQLTGPDTGPGDWFGESAALSGQTAVVGAPHDDNRRDGTPFPFDDEGRMEPAVCQAVGCSGETDGSAAGSVYTFELGVP